MNQYKPYPAYRGSGVEWLGRVPEHWEARPLWAVASCNDDVISDGTDKDFEFDYIDISSVSLDKGVNETTRLRFADAPSRARRLVKRGDIIISTVRTYLRALAVIDEDHEGCVASTGFAVVRSLGEVSTAFLGWALLSDIFISAVEARSEGVSYPAINATDLVKLKLPVPQLDEQRCIAAFLDRETARIDALIEKKQRLIELLREKRQAVITQAVTKGLDPNVPMKDSGVEWLGEVPAHWEVTKVGWLSAALTYGFTNPMPSEDDGPKMLTANDIGWGEVNYENARSTSPEAFAKYLTDKSRPQKGDLLITKDGTLGRVAVHDGRQACINQSVALLRVIRIRASSDFVALALLASVYQDKMVFDAGGTTIKHIYISRLAKMEVTLPPLSEQRQVVEHLFGFKERLDALVTRVEVSLQLLRERRSALITAAVTGQIDVRDAA